MLEALKTTSIEPKVTQKSPAKLPGKGASLDLESSLEGADFANELEASLALENQAGEMSELKMNPEMLMDASGQLIQGQVPGEALVPQGEVAPKVFDANLIKNVDQIIQPKTTAVPVELTPDQILLQSLNQEGATPANPELLQAMLKSQAQAGRNPAIDMAKAEIDPQLMNMEDFVAHKNLATKKALQQNNAYGLPVKGQVQKAALENNLKTTQTINELGSLDKGVSSQSMNSQQFILNSQIDLGSNLKTNDVQASVKTFDMSQIKTDNPNQIMTQITDYIVQAKAAKEPTVNLRVNHEELGMIDITVNKMASSDAIAINIGAHSVDGKNFFQANSKDLFSHLTSSGLNISDLKVETPNQTAKNDFDFGGQSGRGSFGQEKQFNSEQNQRRHESERRQELWNLLKDKEAA